MHLEQFIADAQVKADEGFPYAAFVDMKKVIRDNFPALVDWGNVEKIVDEKQKQKITPAQSKKF